MTLRVMGVDPGLTRCGVGVIDSAGARRATLVAAGVVRSRAGEPIGQRLLAIVGGLRQAIEEHSPDVGAVERAGRQDDIATVVWTGSGAGDGGPEDGE